MTSVRGGVALESTGDKALDGILGGGIPKRSVIVVAGEPGSGKTILTLQMFFGAARQGKKCLYFTTLSEPAMKVVRYVQALSFFDEKLLDTHIVFADLGAAVRAGADAVLKEIAARIEEHEPSFVAIDSFRAIGDLGDAKAGRALVYELANHAAAWGATTLLIGEYARGEHAAFAEFSIADGILCLGSQRQDLTSVRELEVLKLRGADPLTGRHFFEITKDGFHVYPRVRAPKPGNATPSLDDRDATGIAGLDDLLGGGLPRNSATIAQGGTGTGKTVLSLNFLVEGARRGEKCALFALEETPDQLRAIGKALGWDLAALEAEGLLTIQYTSPVELSPDRFLSTMRDEVARIGARRTVLDSLTSLALGVPSERRFKELIYAAAKHMRNLGTSLVMTMESDQLLGSANLSGLGVSFVADNLIQLRYVELGGRLERALSVIKARGISLNSELRSATIGPGGMAVVGDRFKDLRGVLTGLPTPAPGR